MIRMAQQHATFLCWVLQTQRYQDAVKTRKSIMEVIDHYQGLKPSTDAFEFPNGTSRNLLTVKGTIPIVYKSATYQIPVIIWLLDTYPVSAPVPFVNPTADMRIRVSKHVDINGKISLPYLRDWKHDTSDILYLIQLLVMTFSDEPPVWVAPPPDQLHLRASKDQALEDFGRLMQEGDDLFADVAIVTDTRTFMAHKCILAARSKVFAAMFTIPMTEAEFGSVEIKEFDDAIVEGMLQHVYTGQVTNLKDQARSFLQIAEKYDLEGLKTMTEDCIAHALTVENAAETLSLAHLVNSSPLKSKTVEFIILNKEAVAKTDAFELHVKSNLDLLLELFLNPSEHSEEKDIN